jgi:ribose 5-phosphate isomerase B
MKNTLKKIIIGSDHAGFELKEKIKTFLNKKGFIVEDVGTFSKESVDYPDISKNLCAKVIEEDAIGVILCGSGIGVSMACNRNKKIRCALVYDKKSAALSRKHNDANVIALASRVLGFRRAKIILDIFLKSTFEGGRHEKRVGKLANL